MHRGDDQDGTPSAPCGRLCHSNGYDYQAQSRQYVCGLPCPAQEQKRCLHHYGVLGYCHRMRFEDHPRLIGPMQRASKAWQDFYTSRSSSEHTTSYDQEVVGKAHPLRMRGLKAFRFAGAIRTLAQLLRRALNFVLDVTYPWSKRPVAQTSSTRLFDNLQLIDSALRFSRGSKGRSASWEKCPSPIELPIKKPTRLNIQILQLPQHLLQKFNDVFPNKLMNLFFIAHVTYRYNIPLYSLSIY